jgi:hypothetical protein
MIPPTPRRLCRARCPARAVQEMDRKSLVLEIARYFPVLALNLAWIDRSCSVSPLNLHRHRVHLPGGGALEVLLDLDRGRRPHPQLAFAARGAPLLFGSSPPSPLFVGAPRGLDDGTLSPDFERRRIVCDLHLVCFYHFDSCAIFGLTLQIYVARHAGSKKKPTWWSTLRCSITSAYSLTGLPALFRLAGLPSI